MLQAAQAMSAAWYLSCTMSRIPLVGFCLLLGLGASACTSPTGPTGLAQWEHQAFYQLDTNTIWLEVPAEGASWSNADVHDAHNPALTRAWEAAEAPASPLIGRDHAQWIRALDAHMNEDGSLHLAAKALAPYPIRFSLIAVENGQERLLGQLDSEAWSAGTHFAKVGVDYLLPQGDAMVILRSEGAYQAMESMLRVHPVQPPGM